MRRRKLKFVVFLSVIFAVVLLQGCINSTKVGEIKNQNELLKKTIEFQHYFSGSMSGGINQMVQKLNTEQNAYTVKAIPIDHESFKVRINDALNSNNAADMYSYWAGAKTKAVASKLLSLNDVWQQKSLDKLFPKAIIDSACTYDNKKLLIPITQHFVGIVYNKKVFQDLKLTIPQNWNGFIRVCRILKEAKKIPIALGSKSKWPAQFWFDYLLLRTSPYEFRENLMTGKASYTDKRVERAFLLWKSLIDKGYFNDNSNEIEWDTGAADMVYSGRAAMTLMGTWIIGYYSDDKHRWSFGEDYDIFEFPIIDKNIEGCSLGPIDGIVIPANSINKEEAKQTIAYFTRTDAQKAMSEGSGAFAPSVMVERSFYSKAQLRLLDKIRKNPRWAFNYDLATPPEVSDIGLNAFDEFLAFPSEYKSVLKEIQTESAKLFKLQPN